MHLIVDGYHCSQQALSDSEGLTELLTVFPETISMNAISDPQVQEYHGSNPEDWGLSGFVRIAESHISFHTFPVKKFVNVDIFSCKNFDVDMSIDLIRSQFKIGIIEHKVLSRGLEYLTLREAYSGVAKERMDLVDRSHD